MNNNSSSRNSRNSHDNNDHTCPRLQNVLRKMSQANGESSSDSELERTRKRKSVLMQSHAEGSAMAEMFGYSSGESAVR